MTYFYVYAPFYGYCTSKIATREYCPGVGGGTHYAVGGSGFDYPMDIGFQYGPSQLDFIASSNIHSIRTTRRNGIVCGGSATGGIDDALQIEMFTGLGGAGTMVAKLLYAHIKNPAADDIYNCYAWNGKSRIQNLGLQPSYDPNYDGCYSGVHTHFEATNINGYNANLGTCSSPYPTTSYGEPFLYEFVA